MILGGDQPWTRRVIGVSTCPQVGSMFNEGIWNAPTKTWEGSANPRTMEGDEANYTAFLLGTPSLQAAGCSTQPILKLPRAWVVLCILHLTMAMGRLLGEFVHREARLVTPRSVKTCKFSCRRGVQVGAFMGQHPRMGRRRPIFLTHGRILLSASALGQARPSTRPSQTCGTCCRPSIVHIRALTHRIVLLWRAISGDTALLEQHHGIY